MSPEQSKTVYGTEDMDVFVKSVQDSITFKHCGPGMVIMSLMSDVQEEIKYGLAEEARQTLNRAKFLVNLYLPMKDE